MDGPTFQKRADECLQRVTRWLEGFDPDELDYTGGDGVVTLNFADGKRFVLNRQSATNQMWFAAVASAWHFRWDEERSIWVDEKDGCPLLERVGGAVSEKLGRRVTP
ncbi:MAG: iron donor protein CyaY [Planctomycetes bacterium]|nr:iron donor protein CyaY [Planctomycetota bacterium]